MGGVWAPPLKLADGVWFGIDDAVGRPGDEVHERPGLHALRPARRRRPARCSAPTSPPTANRAALFGLQLTNPGAAAKTVTVKVDAHSELMGAYPWGFTAYAERERQPRRPRRFDGRRAAVHRRRRAARRRPRTTTRRSSPPATTRRRRGGRDRRPFRGPQPGDGLRRPTTGPDAERVRRRPVRQGHRRPAALQRRPSPARRRETLWVAVAGSDKGVADAHAAARRRARGPGGAARGQDRRARQARRAVAGRRCPATALLQNAIDWGKQNLADLTQTASNLQIRWTTRARPYPAAARHRRRTRAGSAPAIPDYPWIFATDGEYTAFAAVALGQFETDRGPPARAARHLRHPQRPLGHRSRTRSSSDGSVCFGHDARRPQPTDEPTLQHRRDGQVPERGRADLALDRRQPLPRRACTTSPSATCSYVDQHARRRPRRLARGPRATSSARAWARRSSTTPSTTSAGSTTSPTWRASKDDARDRRSGRRRWRDKLRAQLRAARGGTPQHGQYADSLEDPGNAQVQQKHWIGVRRRWRPS